MPDDRSYDGIRPGVYNVDYFSGSQVAIFVGDIFVDEITAIAFNAQQSRRPLYGYADQHFRAMSKGQILIQGQFAINFKEAGYLWLILNEYKKKIKGAQSKLDFETPFYSSSQAMQQNIEQVINNESITQEQRFSAISNMAEAFASLGGFSSVTRASAGDLSYVEHKGEVYEVTGESGVGTAENIFEAFENTIWGGNRTIAGLNTGENRSPDDADLNPFDIFIMYGDFMGDDRANHTIVKLEDVYILSSSQRIEIDPLPVQESYHFIARARI